MTPRRKRGTRVRSRSRLLFQPRDREILRFVGRAGVMELPQIARVFWGDSEGSRVAAARRLRRLTDNGLLDTSVGALHHPNRVTLTSLGAERVPGDGHVLRTRIRGFSPAADHLLAAAHVWSCLTVRLALSRGPRLLRFVTEAEIRRALGRADRALIPDGLAIIGSERTSVVLALECDLATEVAEVFAKKALRYAPHLVAGTPLYGLHLDALLVFAPGRTRLRQLARAVAKSGAAARSFFQDLEGLTPERVLDRLATVQSMAEAGVQSDGDPFTMSLLEEGAA